jgi:hypothetical protein
MSSPAATAYALAGTVAGSLLRLLEGGGQWTLRSLDPEVPYTLTGRFPPRDGVEVDVQASFAVGQGLGDQGELVQFLSGRSDRITVGVELHDTTPFIPDLDPAALLTGGSFVQKDDVRTELEQLERLCRRDPKLRRPPRCRFTFGAEWARDVFVLSAPYTIKRVNSLTGRLAEVYVRLSMVQVVDAYLQTTDPGAPVAESTEVVAGPGDTHELIAAHELGDPSLGVYLRQRDVEHYGGILAPGSRVLVVDRDHPGMRGPGFVSAAFTDDGQGTYEAAYRAHAAARAGARQVPG